MPSRRAAEALGELGGGAQKSQEDNGNQCQSAEEMAINHEEGSDMGAMSTPGGGSSIASPNGGCRVLMFTRC